MSVHRPLFAGHTLGDSSLGPKLDRMLADNAASDRERAEGERRTLNEAIYLKAIRRFFDEAPS